MNKRKEILALLSEVTHHDEELQLRGWLECLDWLDTEVAKLNKETISMAILETVSVQPPEPTSQFLDMQAGRYQAYQRVQLLIGDKA